MYMMKRSAPCRGASADAAYATTSLTSALETLLSLLTWLDPPMDFNILTAEVTDYFERATDPPYACALIFPLASLTISYATAPDAIL